MNFHFAPVQGHTDASYRSTHADVYGNSCKYYTPFIRLEKESIRPRDIKDMSPDTNNRIDLTPQIIFRDENELRSLINIMKQHGRNAIDLNMGCPFPLQTARGRGAATLLNNNLHEAVAKVIEENPDIRFSIKIRLGMKSPEEWHHLIETINRVSVSHITVHPRFAAQQYKGEVDLNQFASILEISNNPIVYNGDLLTPEDIHSIEQSFPSITGCMIGRGLLARPSLIAEYIDGKEWTREKRIETMLKFHNRMLSHYSETLCGESQIISKIAPFWEYAESEIGRKAWKSIKKASNMAKYHSAVALIEF